MTYIIYIVFIILSAWFDAFRINKAMRENKPSINHWKYDIAQGIFTLGLVFVMGEGFGFHIFLVSLPLFVLYWILFSPVLNWIRINIYNHKLNNHWLCYVSKSWYEFHMVPCGIRYTFQIGLFIALILLT